MPPAPDSLLELEGFRREHPWPQRFLDRGKPLEWLWEFALTAAPAKLWHHLIDTSRLNRALGLGEMNFEEKDGVLFGSSRNGGVLHEWVEEPWTWISGHSLTAVRNYSRGFAHVARAIYRVAERDGSPVLLVYFGWIPRGLIGKVALRVGVPPLRKAYASVLDKMQADIEKPRPQPFVVTSPPLAEPAKIRMQELEAELLERGVDVAIVDRLRQLVTSGDELDLYRIQPRKLAHEWQVTERTLLSACLNATRIGLLDLSWDVICPHCRGVRAESNNLSGVANRGACDVCEIDFTTDLENAVEVTFHVHASIRSVPKRYYCSAEPATKQHIKLQQTVESGGEQQIQLRLDSGRYRIRHRGDRVGGYLTVRDGSDTITWRAGEDLGDLNAAPNLTLELVNPGDDEELFVIEEVQWADEALRPSMLFALQEFRDLFSEEYLGSDVQLSVGEQTLMFTDMVGSTEFYREHGDPAAFIKVKSHFESVFAIVADAGGAVVKTIGDAVMGVFPDPLAAVQAAEEINRRFPAKDDDPDAIRLRVSLNRGPCIAVNLNTGIDYFGGTVNTAAKLQACCEAGEVALSKLVYDAPGVAAYLAESKADIDERQFDMMHQTIDYVFWRVS